MNRENMKHCHAIQNKVKVAAIADGSEGFLLRSMLMARQVEHV